MPAAKREQLRDSFWPNASTLVWNRKSEKGFCTVPRTLPLLLSLIKDLTKKLDASRVYLDLWCRVFDEGLIEVRDEEAHAYASGYGSPKRNIRTWQERIKTLEEFGFIKTKPSGSKKYGYILLIHPHRVVEDLKAKNQISDKWWGAYVQRATEVGFPLEKPKGKRQR
jgi:hypothetical protein